MTNNIEIIGLVAAILTILGVVGSTIRWLVKVNSERLDKLQNQKETIKQELDRFDTLSKYATTQGRRMDLYIYKESVLEDARFQYMRRYLGLCLSSILYVFLISLILYHEPVSIVKSFLGELGPRSVGQSAQTVGLIEHMWLLLVLVFLVSIFTLLFYSFFQLKQTAHVISMVSEMAIKSTENSLRTSFKDYYAGEENIEGQPISKIDEITSVE